MASSDPFNILNISGNCSLTRTITLQSFPNILIEGPANLSGGTAICGAAPPPGTFPGPIFNIVNTRNVTLRRFNISGGGGIILQDSSGSFSGVSIDGSRSEGLNVQGASTVGLQGAIFTAGPTVEPAPNNITNSCGNGINVGLGSSVSFTMEGTISGNGGAGVTVNGGNFTASACCALDTAGSVVIENNRAGVIVGLGGGSASVNGGSTCSGNPGTAAIRNNREWG